MRLEGAQVQSAEAGPDRGRSRQKLRCLAQLGHGDIGRGDTVEDTEIQLRVDNLIPAAGSAPWDGQDVVVHDNRLVRRIVETVQNGAIKNDIVGGIHPRTYGRIGQGDAVVAPIERRDLTLRAAAILFGYMDNCVVEERDAPTAISRGGGVALVEEYVIHVIKKIINNGPIRVLPHEIDSP